MRVLIGVVIITWICIRIVFAAHRDYEKQDHRSWNDRYGGAN